MNRTFQDGVCTICGVSGEKLDCDTLFLDLLVERDVERVAPDSGLFHTDCAIRVLEALMKNDGAQ